VPMGRPRSTHKLLPLNKKRKADPQRYYRIMWTDELHAVIDRALELRAKFRGGGRKVAEIDKDAAPLFLTRAGRAYGEQAFNVCGAARG
jgi:hypothetical protein